jgi:uncharacterized repeat protein (TIGR01451 family)
MRDAKPAGSTSAALHKFCLLFVAAQFGMANLAIAGTNSWTSLGPDGGAISDLKFHPADSATMYALGPVGFYRSSDAGASWHSSSPTITTQGFYPYMMAVGAGGPDYVHLLSGANRTLRSTDRGVTLQFIDPSPTNPMGSSAVAATAGGSAIYHLANYEIYRSVNGGNSHELRGTLPNLPNFSIPTLQVAPSNPQVLYLWYLNGVYRSTDAGATWTTVYTRLNAFSAGVSAVAIDPQNADRVWVSSDGNIRVTDDAGVTWRSALFGTATDLDVDPRNSQIVYASMADMRVMRTTDGGTGWAAMTVPARSNKVGTPRLAIHPADSARLYLFGITGIFVSLDAGATWSTAHAGLPGTSPGRFSRTPIPSGRIFFPIADHGLASLNPDNNSIDILSSPSLWQAAGSNPPNVSAVLALPTRVIASFGNSQIAFSSNAGADWTSSAAPPSAQTHSLAAALNGTWTVFAATEDGVYRSNDLGDHWSRSGNGLPALAPVTEIAVAANQIHLYAAVSTVARATTLYKSLDGGQSWSPTSFESSYLEVTLAVHPTDPQTLIAGTGEGAFKTEDGGATWRPLELAPGLFNISVKTIAIDPVDPNIIYVESPGATGNVRRSVDRGTSFQRLMPNFYDGSNAESLLVDPDRPHRVLAAVPWGSVREISIEPDLRLTAAAPSAATPNSQVEFTMTVLNAGPFDATGVQVEVRLPTGVNVTSATSNDTSCAIANNVATCTVGILRFDESAVIRVRTTPTAEGPLAVTSNVRGAQPDSASGNNTASASVSVASPSPPPAPVPPPSNSGGGGGGSFGVFTALAWLLASLARRSRKVVH